MKQRVHIAVLMSLLAVTYCGFFFRNEHSSQLSSYRAIERFALFAAPSGLPPRQFQQPVLAALPGVNLQLSFFEVLFCTGVVIVLAYLLIMINKHRAEVKRFAKSIYKLETLDEALSESEKRYSILVEKAKDGICLVKKRKFIFVNKSFADMLEYTTSQLIGQNIHNIMHESEFERIRVIHRRRDERNTDMQNVYEAKLKTKSGKVLDVEVSSSIIQYEGEQVDLAFVRDISERNALHEKLYQAQKMESIARMAGGIAHDYNNLLTAILGHSSMLLSRVNEDDPMYTSLSEIHRSAIIAAELTEQLLATSQKRLSKRDVINLNETIYHVNTLISRSIGHKNLVQLSFADDIKPIEVDEHRMTQTILSIAINSRDAMPEGGILTIKTSNESLDEGFCRTNSWASPGDYVRLAISDTGIGIDPSIRDKIFDPFFTTKEAGHGIGLGLSVVYGFVKNHNSLINVKSEQNKGTTFEIYFPVSSKKIEKKKSTMKEHQANQHPPPEKKILIIDDEELVRKLVKTILEQEGGYETLCAADGEEGLKTFKENADDIGAVLLDLTMPRMDGIETLSELKKFDRNISVILSSGYSIEEKAKSLISDGVTTFLQKPYQIEELLEAVRAALLADKPLS